MPHTRQSSRMMQPSVHDSRCERVAERIPGRTAFTFGVLEGIFDPRQENRSNPAKIRTARDDTPYEWVPS
jgi:hypothetical protein